MSLFFFLELRVHLCALHSVHNSLLLHLANRASFTCKTDSFSWGHGPDALACKARPSSDQCGTSLSVSLSWLSLAKLRWNAATLYGVSHQVTLSNGLPASAEAIPRSEATLRKRPTIINVKRALSEEHRGKSKVLLDTPRVQRPFRITLFTLGKMSVPRVAQVA